MVSDWRSWVPVWSTAAALRAVRAAVVVPGLFALGVVLLGNRQLATFAAFGGFATLVFASFGGSRRHQLGSHLVLTVVGAALVVIGTAVNGQVAAAALVTVPVAFLVLFGGLLGPGAASGGTAALLAYVLPAASPGTLEMIPSRLAGWVLASLVGTAAVLLLRPRQPGSRLRAAVAASADSVAAALERALARTTGADPWPAAIQAKHALLDAFTSGPFRPTGLAAADQGLAGLVESMEWTTSVVGDALADGAPARAGPADRALFTASARILRDVAGLARGEPALPDLEALERHRAGEGRSAGATPAPELLHAAFHADAVSLAVRTTAMYALLAGRHLDAEAVAELRRSWYGEAPLAAAGAAGAARSHPVVSGLRSLASGHASLRSVWLVNSVRGAVALAAAVAVADLSNVQQGFWVVLGALSVLRTSALSTGANASRALAGTVLGFALGGALILAIGNHPPVLWAVLPVAVLVASYTPGTSPFALGQAAFTVALFVLYNLLAPVGWQVGLLRLEDVALGCGVSVVVGALFWPRGASGVVVDDLSDAFRRGADYLGEAARWALGLRAAPPDSGGPAVAAGLRLDDALRGYLTEQGSKRIAKEELWRLVGAALRLRLTAHSLATLHDPDPETAQNAELAARADHLAGWYRDVAGLLARPPVRGRSEPGSPALDASAPGETLPVGPPSRVWVALHLEHLRVHMPDVVGPAEQALSLRRRPWWR